MTSDIMLAQLSGIRAQLLALVQQVECAMSMVETAKQMQQSQQAARESRSVPADQAELPTAATRKVFGGGSDAGLTEGHTRPEDPSGSDSGSADGDGDIGERIAYAVHAGAIDHRSGNPNGQHA